MFFESFQPYEKEEWRDCASNPFYQVSSLGRVLSKGGLDKRGRPVRGKILKGRGINSRGYITTRLSLGEEKSKSITVHRLVAEAFLPNETGLPQINHIDGNKTNNRVENLEWCDNSHNQKHSIRIGLKKKIKINEQIAEEIRDVYERGDVSQYKLASIYNLSQQQISKIVRQQRWSK